MYGSGEPDTIGVVCFLIVVIPDRKKKKREKQEKNLSAFLLHQ